MSDLLPFLAPYSGWTLILHLFLLGLYLAHKSLFPKLNPSRRSCPKCHYDLRFSPTPTCSECGHTLRSESESQRPPRKPLLALLSLLLATALPTYILQHRIRQYGWDYYTRLYPLYFFSPDTTLYQTTSGPYRIRIYEDRRRYHNGARYQDCRVEITRDGKCLWSYADAMLCAGAYLNMHTIPAICDLDQDGTPEFICQSRTGGSASNYLIHIFRLGDQLDNLNPHDPTDLNDGIYDILDLDHDGKLELLAEDFAFVNFHTADQESIYPTITYRLDRHGLHPAPDLMRTPEPPIPLDRLQALAIDCRQIGIGPDDSLDAAWPVIKNLTEPMTTLLYSGHYDTALQFLDQAWPGTENSKQLFLNEFDQRVNRSPIKPTLYQLGYHPPSPPSPAEAKTK